MNVIDDAAVFDVAARVIDRAVAEFGDLHVGIRPERRRDLPAFDGFDRWEMRIRIEDDTPRAVRDANDNAGNDRPLKPELGLSRMSALDVAHHMANAAVEIDLRLPVKIDVRANPQNRRRENEYEKEDCRVQQGNLR